MQSCVLLEHVELAIEHFFADPELLPAQAKNCSDRACSGVRGAGTNRDYATLLHFARRAYDQTPSKKPKLRGHSSFDWLCLGLQLQHRSTLAHPTCPQ
jgi:hypothetical protein